MNKHAMMTAAMMGLAMGSLPMDPPSRGPAPKHKPQVRKRTPWRDSSGFAGRKRQRRKGAR